MKSFLANPSKLKACSLMLLSLPEPTTGTPIELSLRGNHTVMKAHSLYTVVLMLVLCSVAAMAQDPAHRMDRYNVVWDSAGADATDSMPIGNGDLAANVYAIEGDALYLLLSKSDAFDWRGSLIKTGRVKVSVKPNPFSESGDFRQKLEINLRMRSKA